MVYDMPFLRRSRSSRRAFLATMTAAGLGLAASRLIEAAPVVIDPSTGIPTDGDTQFAGIPGSSLDVKVLNYALTLEILEADLYRQALNLATKRDITAPLEASPADYKRKLKIRGLNGDMAKDGFTYLAQFAFVEAAHRDFLATAISGLGEPAVTANPAGYKFPVALPPKYGLRDILELVLPLEATGVKAYLGALPYLSSPDLQVVAGGIFSTEARHTAAVAYALGENPQPSESPGDSKVTPNYPSPGTFEYFLSPTDVLAAAAGYFA